MANYLNLYRWEKGLEPEWVFEARKDHIEAIKQWRIATRKRSSAEAISLAAGIIEGGGRLDYSALSGIGAQCKLGPVVLRRILEQAGFEFERTLKGYPAGWPWFVKGRVSEFIGRIKPGQYRDEWLSVEDCVIWVMRAARETEEYITARGMRMALEAEGFVTVRRADGRGIVGYVLSH